MADILIRGMEMPERCGECPFYRLEGAGNGMYWDYCAGKRGIVCDPDNERESDCPLIALPEGHGRLVDADALKTTMDECIYSDRDRFSTGYAKAFIEHAPVIDAVPVVRCKDCKHRDPEDHKCDCGAMERQGCPFPVDDDYFCKYGERKGGDE